MKFTRKAAVLDVLDRIKHRKKLLEVKTAESISGLLPEEKALELSQFWVSLFFGLETSIDDDTWGDKAIQFGNWAGAVDIPFEVVMEYIHEFRRIVMPLIVREYEGLEGYLAGHLALDEAISILMGKIPSGYYLT